MSEKKNLLNDESLEDVNGGTIWIGRRVEKDFLASTPVAAVEEDAMDLTGVIQKVKPHLPKDIIKK